MREVKFRIFITKHGGRYKGIEDSMYPWEEILEDFETLDVYKSPFYFATNPEHADKYILMQYTGEKDWKKNEIWEGDIMRDPTNSVTGVVTWEEGAFFLKVPETGNRYILYMETRHFNGEVIGNIYENKELLNG